MADPTYISALSDRQCVICGAPFSARSMRTRTCGMVCGKALSDRARRDNANARKQRRCEQCGAAFTEGNLSSRQRAAGHYQRFCSRGCAASAKRLYSDRREARIAERKRAAERAGIEWNGPWVPQDAVCRCCGASFTAKSASALYCSQQCRNQVYGSRQNPRDRSARPCRECGTEFAPEYGDRRRVYCSDACCQRYLRRCLGNNHRTRARYHGVAYEPVSRLKVFDRDGWQCQICGCRTPRKLMGKNQPTSPELDHRVPMALGGPHTYANCQCACRSCNGRKGGTLVVGQLPLFP